MDVQPTLSPFNPAQSYSLIVDDLFNLEDHEISLILTDEEGFDDDYNNSDRNNNLLNAFQPYIYEDDHMLEKEESEPNEEEMILSVENKSVEEIIFDPHISDGKEIAKLELMNTFHDTKENINYSLASKYQDNKSILLSSLCSNHLIKPLNGSQDQTLPIVSGYAPMLPPCRVCGEKASGFHYGANTCEACKGFFRRSLQRKQSYRCLGNNDCDISSGKRNICAACRYQKCVALGMSKTAIKTGRYTHAKKTKDIQEVKRLQRKQMINDHQLDPSSQFLVFTDLLDEELAEKIVDGIMEVHRQQTPHTPEFFGKLSQKEQDYLTRRKLKEEMFGPLRPISRDEYTNIYHCTGIDVDGRKAMLEHMLPCIERAVKRFVTFAKAVPGFKELLLEDQIKLIKGSRFEAWLISSYRAFNSEHLLYTHYCGNTVHLENMARLYDENFLKDVFKIVRDIKRLDLTEEEECMLKAILIFFRDRSVLQDPDMVDAHQMRLVQALNFIHLKRKPKDKIFFGRISAVLTEMRTLTDIHKTQENKIQVEWATDVPIPPLLYELFYV